MAVLVLGTALAETPGEAFEELLDAVYEGDAAAVGERLSTETLMMLDMVVTMIKLQPGEAAAEFSEELGTEISADQIMEWTSMDFIGAVILSPGFLEELPPREQIGVSHFEIEGDSCTVYVSVQGAPQPFGMVMELEDDQWKLSENLIQGPVQ
jgi:hypothetical protein